MGFIGTAKLATAVSEAGALGMITASATRTPERFREHTSDKSFHEQPLRREFQPSDD